MTPPLQPYPAYKPSGVDWLGDVPAHWDVRRLRYLAHITTGERDTIDRKDDGNYPFSVLRLWRKSTLGLATVKRS